MKPVIWVSAILICNVMMSCKRNGNSSLQVTYAVSTDSVIEEVSSPVPLLIDVKNVESSSDSQQVYVDSITLKVETMFRERWKQYLDYEKIDLNSEQYSEDTIINGCHISFHTESNKDEIYHPYLKDGTDTLLYYSGRNMLVDIQYADSIRCTKRIGKSDFYSYLLPYYLEKAILDYPGIMRMNDDTVYLDLSICVPDTDLYYQFEVGINKKAELSIRDITPDDEPGASDIDIPAID